MVDILSAECARVGFEVLVAKTGAEAVKKFKEFKPDLMLLDLLLPDEKGFDALRKIRREEGGVQTRVIVLSNLSESTDIEEAKRLGVVEYLIKANTSLLDIIEKIKSVLRE